MLFNIEQSSAAFVLQAHVELHRYWCFIQLKPKELDDFTRKQLRQCKSFVNTHKCEIKMQIELFMLDGEKIKYSRD